MIPGYDEDTCNVYKTSVPPWYDTAKLARLERCRLLLSILRPLLFRRIEIAILLARYIASTAQLPQQIPLRPPRPVTSSIGPRREIACACTRAHLHPTYHFATCPSHFIVPLAATLPPCAPPNRFPTSLRMSTMSWLSMAKA